MLKIHYNQKDYNGFPPLIEAFLSGNMDIVRELIKNGANVNMRYQGLTLLHYVLQSYPDLELTQLIVKHTKRIDKRKYKGDTYLHYASSYGNLMGVQVLLGAGADANEKNGSGELPLHIATYNHHPKIVQELLGYTKNINEKTRYGYTAKELSPKEIRDLIENYELLEIKEPEFD